MCVTISDGTPGERAPDSFGAVPPGECGPVLLVPQGRRRAAGLTPYTLHPTPYTLHPTPYTLHPTPSTLHPQPYTLNPTP